MFHLDQQTTDSNPWPDQSNDNKTLENANGSANHLTPLTDVPDEEDEEDNASSSKESDGKRPSDPNDQYEGEQAEDTKEDKPNLHPKQEVSAQSISSPEHRNASVSSPNNQGPPSSSPSTPLPTISPLKSSHTTPTRDPRVSILLEINAEILK